MKTPLLIVIIMVGLSICGWSAESDSSGSFTPYLGISLPVPQEVPLLQSELKEGDTLPGASVVAVLHLDKKGKVKDLTYQADSTRFVAPFEEKLKDLKFDFLDGQKLDFPMAIPVLVTLKRRFPEKMAVTIDFPVARKVIDGETVLITQREVLEEFFRLNHVRPPQVLTMPPVQYTVSNQQRSGRYPIVVAAVRIDEKGNLVSLTFPYRPLADFTHPAEVAVIWSRFTPLEIDNRPCSTDFLIFFRFFDNIDYPFSPLYPSDSIIALTPAERNFMTIGYNIDELALQPITRKYRDGRIPATIDTKGYSGQGTLNITVSADGKVFTVYGINVKPGAGTTVRDVIYGTTWYPAVDLKGEPIPYSGRIDLNIEDDGEIVIYPEWRE